MNRKKKYCICTAIALLTALFPAADLAAENDFHVMITGSWLSPRDSNYTSVYGNGGLLPELTAGIRLKGPVFLWAGYGSLGAEGETPVFEETATSRQSFLSLGVGFRGRLAGDFSYDIDLGAVRVSYEEEALGLTASGSALGVRVDAGISLSFSRMFMTRASVGYLSAGKDLDGVRIRMGGFRAGLGLGVSFQP